MSDSIDGVELLAWRQDDLPVVRDPRLTFHLLELVEALRDDASRLAHLVHPHAVAVVHVAVRIDGDLEVDRVVREVRLVATHVPVDARRTQHRPRLPERDRVGRTQQSDPPRALEPDLVAIDELLVLVDGMRHTLDELAALGVEAARNVLGEPAGLEVARVHARAGDELGQVEDLLALAEAVPEHRDRSELEPGRAEPDEVRMDPVQLAQQHAHPGRLARHLDLEQLFDREHEDELVVLERDVVDPLGVRDRLPPRLLLHVLLEARCAGSRSPRAARRPSRRAGRSRGGARRASTGGWAEVDLEDVLRVRRDLEDGRDRRRDARPLVDARALGRQHYSASEKRTGSPPIG
jgi:hypothetical protein